MTGTIFDRDGTVDCANKSNTGCGTLEERDDKALALRLLDLIPLDLDPPGGGELHCYCCKC